MYLNITESQHFRALLQILPDPKKKICLLAVYLVVIILLLPRAGTAEETKNPQTCKIGAYLISLYDFDMARGSFGADLWFWSTCPNKDLRPLEVMDFVNANRITRSLPSALEVSGLAWSYVKISGVFRHRWDVRNYPFDRHTLRIIVENTNAPASAFSYTADREGSKPSRDIRLEGWRITGFQIEEQTYVYDTVFGDPAFGGKGESDYARLIISVPVARTKLLSFFKLVTGVYVAIALSMLSFLMGAYNGRRRINILVGTLFAVLVNQRVVETEIGRSEFLTLVDEIHIAAMVFIFGIALAGIYSQSLFDRELQEQAARNDKRGLWITIILYIVINGVLVWTAATRG